jgi:hypothetical protein
MTASRLLHETEGVELDVAEHLLSIHKLCLRQIESEKFDY